MAIGDESIQLKDFEANDTPIPGDIVYCGDSTDAYNEVKSTIADIIAAYPGLFSIGSLTTGANQLLITTDVDTYATLDMGTGVSDALEEDVVGTGGIGLIETGTFVPIFTSSGGGTATYDQNIGSYTIVGDRLFFDCTVFLTGLPSAGTVTITGLPVPCNDTYYSAVNVHATNLDALQEIPLTGTVNPSTSHVVIYNGFNSGSNFNLVVSDCTSTAQFVISGFYLI
jgi:hypothetical protein